MTEATLQYVTFFLNDALLGVNVLGVQELLPPHKLTHVPLSAPELVGLLNLRGNIVPALDLRYRLGLPGETDLSTAMNVVVRHENSLKSFLVDRVGDVLDLPASSFEPSPGQDSHQATKFTEGVHQLKNGLLLVLDVKTICGSEKQSKESVAR